jgi:tetratricopeptide (TPR) repeat protein
MYDIPRIPFPAWIIAALLLAAPLAAAPVSPLSPWHLLEDEDHTEAAETNEARVEAAASALDVGRHAAARLDLRRVLREEPYNQRAARMLAELYDRTGDYRLAQRALESCISAAEDEEHAVEPATLVVLGRILYTRGEYPALKEVADRLLELASEHPEAALDGHLFRGNVHAARGLYDDAREEWGKVREVTLALRRGPLRVPRDDARHSHVADLWATSGEAYYHLNRLHDANEAWGLALDADERHVRTNEWMARLYLDQNADSSSRVNYSEPSLRHNGSLAGMRVRLAAAHFYRWRMAAGMAQLDEAIEINPNHPEALALRALRYLYTDQYDAARADYERALRVNPLYVEALGAKALHAAMLGMDEQYDEAEQAMLGINPRPARFYEIIADGLADRFRYVEALPLYERAIKANPRHWTAFRGRGLAAMNHGDDVLGREMLEIALENDPLRNNIRTRNLLILLDSYRHFERIETEDGRFRLLVHRSEAPVMVDTYLEHLNWAWEDLVRKYDFTPRTPITVEAFHRHEDFEVRTIGITGLPALGACFGQLITLDSPGARPPGSYNWASTLRHEMDHVWQLQISNGQLPRWLAEGLSVYEEKSTRPEWERHMEDRLFMHYHMDDIPPIRRFNEWFRDGSRIIFAYYLGNVMVEFIDKELGGLGVMRRMLEMFGEKKTPDEVFEACLGIKPEDFDEQFRAYVRDKRIAHLRMVPRIAPSRVRELFFKYEDGETTTADLVDLALGYAQQGSRIDAETYIGLARGADEGEGPDPVAARYHYVRAMVARMTEGISSEERGRRVRGHLQAAIDRGLEDFQTYLQMAQFARTSGNLDSVLYWLEHASNAYPESSQPYAAKFQLHMQSGNVEDAKRAAMSWTAVDENNLQVRSWLIQTVYIPGEDWEGKAEMAEQILNVAPLDRRHQRWRARALRELGQYEDAVRHFEFARSLAAGSAAELRSQQADDLLDIADSWLRAGDREKAREALEGAKRLNPEHTDIPELESRLNE